MSSELKVSQVYTDYQLSNGEGVFDPLVACEDALTLDQVQQDSADKIRHVVALMTAGNDLIVTLETRSTPRREE